MKNYPIKIETGEHAGELNPTYNQSLTRLV